MNVSKGSKVWILRARKARVCSQSEKRESEKKHGQMDVNYDVNGRKVVKHLSTAVFSQCFLALEGRNVGSLK